MCFRDGHSHFSHKNQPQKLKLPLEWLCIRTWVAQLVTPSKVNTLLLSPDSRDLAEWESIFPNQWLPHSFVTDDSLTITVSPNSAPSKEAFVTWHPPPPNSFAPFYDWGRRKRHKVESRTPKPISLSFGDLDKNTAFEFDARMHSFYCQKRGAVRFFNVFVHRIFSRNFLKKIRWLNFFYERRYCVVCVFFNIIFLI